MLIEWHARPCISPFNGLSEILYLFIMRHFNPFFFYLFFKGDFIFIIILKFILTITLKFI